MNYRYQMVGTGVAGANGLRTWSYSRGSCDTSGIGACTNTCVTFSGRQCVPTNQTSPKAGCNPNTAGCDCDNAEWANMNLDIPANDPMSYVACQISNCSGSDGLGRDPARELTARAMRRYFLGQDDGVLGQVRALARERKRLLVQKGLRDGVDFVEDLATGRLYSRE